MAMATPKTAAETAMDEKRMLSDVVSSLKKEGFFKK